MLFRSELVRSRIRSRVWFRKELLRLVAAGRLTDEGAGVFGIVPNENKASAEDTTRRWDGEPETPADTRFFDLRAAGYTGPIDQDGYIDTTTHTELRDRDGNVTVTATNTVSGNARVGSQIGIIWGNL